jgi:hypothetical protein
MSGWAARSLSRSIRKSNGFQVPSGKEHREIEPDQVAAREAGQEFGFELTTLKRPADENDV